MQKLNPCPALSFRNGSDERKAICALDMEALRFCLSIWPGNLGRLTAVIRKYEPVFRYVRAWRRRT